MEQEEREAARRRVLELIAIEEDLGPVVSGGPSRGAWQKAEGQRKAPLSAACRARGRVRFLARAVSVVEEQAA